MIRRSVLLVTVCSCFLSALAQRGPSLRYLSGYIKVWGFLKYYHPAIGAGRIEADSFFLQHLPAVSQVKNNKEYGQLMQSLLAQLGPVARLSLSPDTSTLFTANDRTTEIINDRLLPIAVRQELKALREYGYTDSLHRYLPANFHLSQIPAEKAYTGIRYPDTGYQLLAFARYWNAIEYLFPYKYMLAKPWSGTLVVQLPFFAKPMTQTVFEKHLLMLNAAIEDSHGGIVPVKNSAGVYGPYFPPFAFRFAGDSLVVTAYIDTAECLRQDIRPGDVIIALRKKKIAAVMKEYGHYVAASNTMKQKDLLSSLPLLLPLRGFDSVVHARLLRAGKVLEKQVVLQKMSPAYSNRLNALYREQTKNGTTQNDFVLRSLSGNIAWLDAANLSVLYNSTEDDRAIDSVLALMRTHRKAILLDMRCYATQAVFYNKFLAALGWQLKPFAVLQPHYKRFPGLYYTKDMYGPANKPVPLPLYPGQLIILVNEQTQSQSELITMILQASGPAMVIGTQTAGCDGDLINLPVPGGYTLKFSGRHVAYPDGTPSQQVGVKIDKRVRYTTKAIAAGRDEVLEKALEVVNGR